MTAATIPASSPFPTPEPKPAQPEPLTVYEVYELLQAHSVQVQAEIAALKAEGIPVSVPAYGVVLCELAGLTVDLATGLVTGVVGGHVACVPGLRERLVQALGAEVLATERIAATVAGVIVIDGSAVIDGEAQAI